jgi:hypothetical protein
MVTIAGFTRSNQLVLKRCRRQVECSGASRSARPCGLACGAAGVAAPSARVMTSSARPSMLVIVGLVAGTQQAGLKDKRGFIDRNRLDLSERQAVEYWMKRGE